MGARPSAIVLVVAIIVLAGCGGFFGDELLPDSDDEPAHPPGVSSSGLDNATALSTAHDRSLTGESYELAVNQEVMFDRDGQNSTTESERVVSMTENGTFLVEARTRGPVTVNETVWANGSTAYVRTEQGDEVQYDRRDATRLRPQLSGYGLLREYLAAGEFDVESVERRDGRTFTTLRADEFAGGGIGSNFQNVSSYEATALVDETGRIHELTVRLEGVQNETSVTLDLRVELHNSSVDASRPDWVDEARERNQ